MTVERSNFFHTETARVIPASCPKEFRAKIEAAREQRSITTPHVEPAKEDKEGWELLKKFAAEEAA